MMIRKSYRYDAPSGFLTSWMDSGTMEAYGCDPLYPGLHCRVDVELTTGPRHWYLKVKVDQETYTFCRIEAAVKALGTRFGVEIRRLAGERIEWNEWDEWDMGITQCELCGKFTLSGCGECDKEHAS